MESKDEMSGGMPDILEEGKVRPDWVRVFIGKVNLLIFPCEVLPTEEFRYRNTFTVLKVRGGFRFRF